MQGPGLHRASIADHKPSPGARYGTIQPRQEPSFAHVPTPEKGFGFSQSDKTNEVESNMLEKHGLDTYFIDIPFVF